MAAVQNLLALAQGHEPVPGAALTIAGGTEAWHIAQADEPVDYLVQGTLVADIKLGRIVVLFLFLHIAAYAGAGAAANLGNAQLQCLLADSLALTGGDNHAGIWHGHTDESDDFLKDLIADAVVKGIRINIVSLLDTRHADGMRAYPMDSLQVLCVHEDAGKFIAVHLQAEEYPQANIVYAALLGTVHGLGMVGVVMLWPGWVQCLIGLFIVGLLEEDIGADAGIVELLIVFHCGGSNVYVDTADGTVLMLDIVNGIDGLQHILDRIVDRILPQLDGKALVAHILQCRYLLADLLLCELLAADVLVLHVIWTVYAAVDTVVGQVERSKEHDTVAVVVFLYLPGQVIDFLQLFLIVAGQQHGGFPVGEAFSSLGFGNDGIYHFHIVLVLVGILESCLDFFVGDKLLCLHGFYVVHTFSTLLKLRLSPVIPPALNDVVASVPYTVLQTFDTLCRFFSGADFGVVQGVFFPYGFR